MSGVRQVVTDTMRQNGMQGYVTQAEPVIKALEEAAAGVAEELRGIAVDKGLSEADANAILVQVGLVEDTPAAGGGDAATAGRLARLEAFAKQHGFRG